MEIISTELYRLCIRVPENGIKTVLSTGQESMLKPIIGHLGEYGSNSGLITFVNEKGETYISPFCEEVSTMLAKAGYTRTSIGGRMSGERIIDPEIAKVWETMEQLQQNFDDIRREKEYTKKINSIADKIGIGELPDFIKGIAIRVPEDGIKIKSDDKETKRLSFPKYTIAGGVSSYRIGKYYLFDPYNPDFISLVDRNGDCYLIPEIFKSYLEECGFIQSGGCDINFGRFGESLVDERILAEYMEVGQEIELLKKGKVDLDFIINLANKKAEKKGIKQSSTDKKHTI